MTIYTQRFKETTRRYGCEFIPAKRTFTANVGWWLVTITGNTR